MSSVERFNRTLTDRQQVFKQLLDQTIGTFSASNDAQKTKLAGELATAGRDLLDMLTDGDRPPWLEPITTAAKQLAHSTNERLSQRFLDTALKHHNTVGRIVINDDSSSYDFDKLYERLRNEGKLPELFDKMIDAVSRMVNSGEIDSVTLTLALRRLLDILRANRNGSYVAVTRSLDYAKFIKNVGIEFLKRIPGIKEFVDAYEKTLNEAQEEREKLEEQLRNKSINLIVDHAMFAKLHQLPEKQPLLLEGPKTHDDLGLSEVTMPQK